MFIGRGCNGDRGSDGLALSGPRMRLARLLCYFGLVRMRPRIQRPQFDAIDTLKGLALEDLPGDTKCGRRPATLAPIAPLIHHIDPRRCAFFGATHTMKSFCIDFFSND